MRTANRTNTILLVLILAVGVAIVAMLATGVRGGPLDPTGSPGSTMKTLQEVEPRTPISSLPYVISQPGSYYLTRNLSVNTPIDGITVQADDVTVDLNGFQLNGNGVGLAAITEGAASPARHNWRMYNGAIVGWESAIFAPSVSNGQIDHLSASGISLLGFTLGTAARLADCSVEGPSSGTGMAIGSGSTVESCTSRDFYYGISADKLSRVTGCSVVAQVGIFSSGATIASCTITATIRGIESYSTGATILGNQIDMGTVAGTCGIYQSGVAALIDGNRIMNSTYGVCLLQNTSMTATRNSFVNLTTSAFSGYIGNDVPAVVAAASATNPQANICMSGVCTSTP